MADRTELAHALNQVAAALQRLAAALPAEDPAPRCPAFQPAHDGTYGPCFRCGRTWTEHAGTLPPLASVAEPECGCSIYARCDQHEADRPKLCTCNGPDFASVDCQHVVHAVRARAHPERDPSLVE